MAELDGKIAIVTGGASGIGRACARSFAKEGATVFVADVQLDRGAEVAESIGATFVECNVANEEHVAGLVDRAIADHGKLDVMFNNAGLGGVVGPIHQQPVEEFNLTVDVMFRGVFLGMKHAARVMRPKGEGVIISTASVAGMLAGMSPHVYAACKAAVIHLTRSVAMELGEVGIRVNCVCPGAIVTPLVSEFLTGTYGEHNQIRDQMAHSQPLRRAGVPDDVAEAVLWLASNRSSFVTGHSLVVDGGITGGALWSEMPGDWMHHYTPMRRPGGI